MLDKLKYYWHTATDHYFVQVDYVNTGKPGDIPVSIDKQYIILNKDESIDYTNDAKQATPFKIILGGIIVKKLRAECKDMPNLQFSLVSVGDAKFIDTIFNGAEVSYATKKEPIDFAAQDLNNLLKGNKGVLSVHSLHTLDAVNKTHTSVIIIDVADTETYLAMGKMFPDGSFKTFPVKTLEQIKPLIK